MPLVQTHIPDNSFGHPFRAMAVEKLGALVVHYPEPDYDVMDRELASIEEIALGLGKIEVLSDENREELKDLAVTASKAVKTVEQSMANVATLPNHVPWRQKAYDKLEHLASRIEDIAETCALSSSKEFTEMVKNEIRSLKDGNKKN